MAIISMALFICWSAFLIFFFFFYLKCNKIKKLRLTYPSKNELKLILTVTQSQMKVWANEEWKILKALKFSKNQVDFFFFLHKQDVSGVPLYIQNAYQCNSSEEDIFLFLLEADKLVFMLCLSSWHLNVKCKCHGGDARFLQCEQYHVITMKITKMTKWFIKNRKAIIIPTGAKTHSLILTVKIIWK